MALQKHVDMQRIGEATWCKVDKINSELFTLTYGALVCQMLKDLDSVTEVNLQLDKMGYNIGIRLIDDFLATSGIRKCSTLRETANIISKVAFKTFLGVTATVCSFDEEKSEFCLLCEDNPLTDLVELPEEYKGKLYYSNIICGVIRGALEMVQMMAECSFTKDTLQGDSVTEIKVRIIEFVKDEPQNDE